MPNRGVPRVPLPGPFPAPGLTRAGGNFSPAWCGPPAVSALTGGCFSLAQLGKVHTPSWLSCMPTDTKAWLSLVCPHTWPTKTAIGLPGLACPQPLLPCSSVGAVHQVLLLDSLTSLDLMSAIGGSSPVWHSLPLVLILACTKRCCSLAPPSFSQAQLLQVLDGCQVSFVVLPGLACHHPSSLCELVGVVVPRR